MSKKFVYEVNVDSGNSVKSLGELETELKDVNKQIKDVGINSEEFNKLSQRSKELSSQISEVNKEVKGINLDAKLKAGDGAIKLLTGSTTTLIGSLGLLGAETEALGKFEEKAASALALSSGVKDLSAGFGQLSKAIGTLPTPTKAATAAQRVFNLVAKANPIGLIITAITIVVGLFLVFNKRIREVISTFLPLNKLIEGAVGLFTKLGQALGFVESETQKLARAQRELAAQTAETLENQLELARALGNDTVELERKLLNERIKATEEFSEERKKAVFQLQLFEAKQLKAANDAAIKRDEERTKAALEANKRYKEILAERAKLLEDIASATAITDKEQLDLNIAQINKQYDTLIADAKKFGFATEKLESARIEKIKELNEDFQRKIQELDEKRLSNIEKLNDDLIKLSIQFINDEEELQTKQRERQLVETEKQFQTLKDLAKELGLDTEAIETEKLIALENLQQKFNIEDGKRDKERLDKIKENQKEVLETLEDLRIQSIENGFDRAREALDRELAFEVERLQGIDATEQEINRLKEFYANQRKLIDQDEFEFQKFLNTQKLNNALDIGSAIVGIGATLFGDAAKENKKIAISEAIISTLLGATKALASAPFPANLPGVLSVLGTGFANVKKIQSTNPTGGGIPTAPSIPSGFDPSKFATSALPSGVDPVTDFNKKLELDRQATENRTERKGEPIRAYVLAGNVRDGLEAENKIRVRRQVGKPE